jgi:hypothetical protein
MDEILAQLFPQAPSYFPGLLGQEQANLLQQQAQRQGLLGIGMGLLQAAAPSTTRPSLGAGIAQGLATGQQMAQNVYAQRLQEQQIAQKLAEQQRALQEQQAARAILPQIMRQGQAQPTFYGQPTASPLRDDEGNVMPGAGVSQGAPSLDLNAALRLLTEAPSVAAKVLPTVQQFQKLGQPERVTLSEGQQVFEMTPQGFVPVAGAPKTEKPSAVRSDWLAAMDDRRKAGLPTISFEQYQENLKRAGAQPLEVKIGPTTATKLIDAAIERANASELAAGGAAQTLRTISDLKPVLSAGVLSGPLSGQTAVVARLASSLGVTGQNTQELLNRTSLAMQRLASLELSAAEQMRGQGAITEGERALIARAAGGNLQSLTVGEVNSLLDALERTAKFKIQGHQANVRRLRNILPEETRSFAEGYTTDFDLGSAPEVRQQAGSAARAAGLVR